MEGKQKKKAKLSNDLLASVTPHHRRPSFAVGHHRKVSIFAMRNRSEKIAGGLESGDHSVIHGKFILLACETFK